MKSSQYLYTDVLIFKSSWYMCTNVLMIRLSWCLYGEVDGEIITVSVCRCVDG